MAKTKTVYPTIGIEYSYLGNPVLIKRVAPTHDDAYVDFETRFGEYSNCQAGELGAWLKPDHVFTEKQLRTRLEHQEHALRNSSSVAETKLARSQVRETKRLLKALKNGN